VDFGWTPEQRERQEAMLARVSEEFASHPPGSGLTLKNWRTLGDLGLLGLCVPPRYGGGGLGALETAGMMEAFGRGCPDTGIVFAASAHLYACAMPVLRHGSDLIKEQMLPRLCSGEWIAGNAMTELDAGSDVSRLAVTAERVPGGYLLNGEKSFVSNGPVADLYVTYATTDADAGYLGVTAFTVERSTQGLTAGEPFAKLGLHSCQAGTVRFDDCFVPEARVLGEEGAGGAVFQDSMTWERTCLFAGYLGLLDRLVERCVGHARQRRQFGRRIAEFQAVANRIVDMKLRTESARLLLYRACWELDQGRDAGLGVALSKLAVSEAAVASALDAVQVFGGRGYQVEYGIEASLRDTVPATIFSGTSDIQRLLIATELGL
jgi:alkylation response protein AidB-like acyl-CoA dehydrogenase